MDRYRSLALIFLLTTSGLSATALASSKESIPIIGVDQNGEQISVPVKVPFFKKRLKKAYKIVSQTSLQALNHTNNQSPAWSLSAMEIGVTLFASIGIGDLVEASAEPTLLFVFKKTKVSEGGLQ